MALRATLLFTAVLAAAVAALASAETLPAMPNSLRSLECIGNGCEGGMVNIRGRSLNLIGDLSKLVPRNGYGQLAFTAGPLTIGAEGALGDGAGSWLSMMAAAPLALFLLWG